MVKFFDYQILANRFVLKLKECKNLSDIFPIDGHEVRKNCLAPWSASPPVYDLSLSPTNRSCDKE